MATPTLPRYAWWCEREQFLYWRKPSDFARASACPDCVLVLITASAYSEVMKQPPTRG